MKNTLCLLLLSFSLQRIKCQSMESIESTTVKKPGETLTLSCRGSGFSFSSWSMHWIRQQAGKPLVWMGRVHSGGSGYDYSESFKGRTEITRDNSKSMVYLKLSGLTAEDSAVYYCARWDGVHYYFDYWGKGTKVTVPSDLKKKPDVFTMSQCESSSDLLTIGCLASGFSPASLDLKWKDQAGRDLSGFMEFPTIQNGDQNYKISLLNITKEKFNQSNITCEAKHQEGNVSKPFSKVSPQKPTLSVVPVITQKSSSVMCVVENFYPRDLTVQLKEKDGKIRKSKLDYKVNAEGLYTAYSLYKVSSETWNSNTDYMCEVTHQGVPINETANFKAKFALTLKPPIQRELFVNEIVVLEAVVSGDVENAVKEAVVSCDMNAAVTPGVKVSKDISQFIRKHKVTVDKKKWFDGEKVTCTISEKNLKDVIHFNKGGGQNPAVFIYRPDYYYTKYVPLVCEVTSPKLGDVYIMWKVSDGPYREGRTLAPIHQNDSTSVFSILTMTKDEYNDPTTTITCEVIHAYIDNGSSPLQVTTSKTKLSLTMKPPIQKELFANDKIVLQAVVSGDVKDTVQNTSVSCKVKDELVPNWKVKTGNVESSDTSQFKKIYDVTVDTEKWFDGHVVTCTIHDTNNNRDIEQKISFQKGDGKKPTVTIYKPDNITDPLSHVCEVTSPKHSDVYVMWKVGNESYREGTTSAPTHQKDSTSVLSILTMTKEEYEKPSTTITCAVIHAKTEDLRAPLQVSTSKSKQQPEISCD